MPASASSLRLLLAQPRACPKGTKQAVANMPCCDIAECTANRKPQLRRSSTSLHIAVSIFFAHLLFPCSAAIEKLSAPHRGGTLIFYSRGNRQLG
ncbi:hypothetical protein BCV70DRAFT_98449 [Testicularia cyperi]|uniref:Uncharacterized protein n=1 Tax=Testicularia cyperi TaxID=1882483 RepID=A0A317XQP2_9BASI|nr:hypothetical protein BCV70DRAFT_98449 [Testicularia cyperi]